MSGLNLTLKIWRQKDAKKAPSWLGSSLATCVATSSS